MLNIIMTQYIYPIKKGGTQKFWNGIYFDNPRTTEEITYVSKKLKEINFSTYTPLPEESYQVGEEYITLRSIVESFCKNNLYNQEVNEFYKKHGKEKNIYKVLAKMWVIIRWDEGLETSKLKSQTKIKKIKGNQGVESIKANIQQKTQILSYNMIVKYLSFLDFMCNTNGGVKNFIIINEDTDLLKNIYLELMPRLLVIAMSNSKSTREIQYPIMTFNMVLSLYNEIIELVGTKYNDKKFIFICNTIHAMNYLYFDNPKMYNVSLVSIIEMLLAHKPDNNRYNIEESITKQFVGKLKILLYESDEFDDMNFLEKELKIAYSIRSDIAHGNFDTIDKNMEKLYSLYGYNHNAKGFEYKSLDSAFDTLNSHLTRYVRILLNNYLKDEDRLDLLKNI